MLIQQVAIVGDSDDVAAGKTKGVYIFFLLFFFEMFSKSIQR